MFSGWEETVNFHGYPGRVGTLLSDGLSCLKKRKKKKILVLMSDVFEVLELEILGVTVSSNGTSVKTRY